MASAMSARTRGPSGSPATSCVTAPPPPGCLSRTCLRRPRTPSTPHDLGDAADVTGVGAAAAAHDTGAGVEEGGIVADHVVGAELVGDGIAPSHGKPGVGIG